MRNTVYYEWDYETWEDNEVIDHNHQDTLSLFTESDKTEHLVLVRSKGIEGEGLTDRLWAYVKDGKLPEYFENDREQPTGYKVPVQYHKELSKYSIQ